MKYIIQFLIYESALTNHSDKNGTTKEIKAEDSKKKEKLPKRTDLKNYLNYESIFYLFFIKFLKLKSDLINLFIKLRTYR